MKTLADLEAPAQVVKTVLEADLQKQCVEWARARGYWARKFSSMSQRSVPDYLFARRCVANEDSMIVKDIKFAVEFKKLGNKPTDAQLKEHHAMEAAGWKVFVVDTFEWFQTYTIAYELDHGMIYTRSNK